MSDPIPNKTRRKRENKTRREALDVVFFKGVAVPAAMAIVVEAQKARCAPHGCKPDVRVTKGHIYFAHDDWCPTVGGTGQ